METVINYADYCEDYTLKRICVRKTKGFNYRGVQHQGGTIAVAQVYDGRHHMGAISFTDKDEVADYAEYFAVKTQPDGTDEWQRPDWGASKLKDSNKPCPDDLLTIHGCFLEMPLPGGEEYVRGNTDSGKFEATLDKTGRPVTTRTAIVFVWCNKKGIPYPGWTPNRAINRMIGRILLPKSEYDATHGKPSQPAGGPSMKGSETVVKDTVAEDEQPV